MFGEGLCFFCSTECTCTHVHKGGAIYIHAKSLQVGILMLSCYARLRPKLTQLFCIYRSEEQLLCFLFCLPVYFYPSTTPCQNPMECFQCIKNMSDMDNPHVAFMNGQQRLQLILLTLSEVDV